MIFPQDPKIDIGTDGFDTTDQHGRPLDLLGRKEFGQRLTDLVDRIEQPLVIALDGEWGSGKSHFLKLWAGAHKKELGGKAEVIYFDAFEHDFLDDPLVSLIGRLADDPTLAAQNPAKLKTLKKVAMPLARIAIKAGFALATFGATNYLGDALDKVAEAVGDSAADSAETASDKFWEKESGRLAAMWEFREGLEALTIKEDGTTQKIVFIIDELDRCRPDYALQMLEIIKHFFAVPNVHFVLGANLRELENSVKARYGADINARKYLQKFVMLEMPLPINPVKHDPTWTIAEEFFDNTKQNYAFDTFRNEDIYNQLKALRSQRSVTIRDLQRILTLIALFPSRPNDQNNFTDSVCVSIAFLYVLDLTIYHRLRGGRAGFQELVGRLGLLRTTEERWNHNQWHAFGALLMSDADLQAINAEMGLITAFRRNILLRFGHTQTQLLDGLLARYFDTFTLPNP